MNFFFFFEKFTCCHGIYTNTPTITAKHSCPTKTIAHCNIGDIGAKWWQTVGGQQGSWCTEDIRGLLAFLPFGATILKPNLWKFELNRIFQFVYVKYISIPKKRERKEKHSSIRLHFCSSYNNQLFRQLTETLETAL